MSPSSCVSTTEDAFSLGPLELHCLWLLACDIVARTGLVVHNTLSKGLRSLLCTGMGVHNRAEPKEFEVETWAGIDDESRGAPLLNGCNKLPVHNAEGVNRFVSFYDMDAAVSQ